MNDRPLVALVSWCKNAQSAQACKSLCISGFGCSGNQLLAAANANNAENAGVRCANTNNRGANTNANYGFPLFTPFGLRLCGHAAKRSKIIISPNSPNLATQKLHGWWRVPNPMSARAMQACKLAKEYEVLQRLVEGCIAASANVLHRNRHKACINPVYKYNYGA
ncbi:MAG: hypothetical protein NC403_09485 [Muribaculaceae bacterium]|nr:hypothetical protein [Muribaculaceae bacterium]